MITLERVDDDLRLVSNKMSTTNGFYKNQKIDAGIENHFTVEKHNGLFLNIYVSLKKTPLHVAIAKIIESDDLVVYVSK
jgi:hypothetical protein